MAIKEQITLEPLCKENVTVTGQMVAEFIDRLQRAKANKQAIPSWKTLIPKQVYSTINLKLHSKGKTLLHDGSFEENVANLRALYPQIGDKKLSSLTPEEAMNAFINDLIRYFKEFKYPMTEEAIDAYSTYVQKTWTGYGIPGGRDLDEIDEEQSRPFIEAIMKFYKEKAVNFKFFGILHQYLLGKKSGVLSTNIAPCQTINEFMFKLSSFFGEALMIVQFVENLNNLPAGYRDSMPKKGKEGAEQSTVNALVDERVKPPCKFCGRPAHTRYCGFQPSPQYSTHPLVKMLDGRPFIGSDVQRRLQRAYRYKDGVLVAHPLQMIPFRETLQLDQESGKEFLVATHEGPPRPPEGKGSKRSFGNRTEFTKKVSFGETTTIPQYDIIKEDLSYLFLNQTFDVNTASQEQLITAEAVSSDDENKKLKTNKVLIDTGAIHYNFITLDIVRRFKLKRIKLIKSIFTSSIHGTEENTHCVFLDTVIKYKDKSCIMPHQQFIIIKDMAQYELIIGLNDIRHYDLTGHLRSYFLAREKDRENTPWVYNLSTGGTENKAAADSGSRQKPVPTQTGDTPTPGRGDDGSIQVYPKDLFMSPLDNDDHIEDLSEESPWSRYFNTVNDNNKIDQMSRDFKSKSSDQKPKWEFKIEGNAAVQATLRQLLEANRDCFATTVSPIPAKIKPFAFDVDHDGWNAEKANKARARLQSAAKNAAIAQFVNQAIADNVIAASDAPAWSQVLLTPKPNGTWRFCLDYRTLNKYTKSAGWPIPNIQDVLANIGSHNPKFFAVMDCTSGYHQMPIEEQCQKYTTFTTFMGNYKWLRAPMGPKNIPSLYQKVMATEIFPDMIHRILEVYLDDLITWSKTLDELTKNLQLIFDRLRSYNLTLNPEKCRFGMSEVEYVGHLINEHGITFSNNKKALVADFPKPENIGTLKSFIGLGSYFRRHIRNFAEIIHPLNEMCEGYNKKKKGLKLEWNEVTSKAFTDTQEAIVNCQMLYYREPSAPLRLYTDASDYGIGGYLCQVIDNIEYPIAFISKTLSKAEKKWSVYEKEAYAIFYALRKWEHYLQGVKFTLFTDHRNLTFLEKDPSPKVQRWRIAVQEYDFDVAFIEGVKNVIADGFSRLCPEDLEVDLEQPIQTIAMFLDSYPQEEVAIDKLIFLPSINEKEKIRSIYRITPEYEWEAKSCLSDHATELNILNSRILGQPRQNKNWEEKPDIVGLNSLLEVKELKHYHIPTEYYNIISACHNSEVGHWGVEETITKVKEYLNRHKDKFKDLVWLGLRKDIDNFIKKCPCCQLNRDQKFQINTKQYTTSKFGLFKNLSIDAIYVPESRNHEKYFLVIIDACSRYVTLHPLRDLSAESASGIIMKHMHRFGIPLQICTDNSTQFKSVFEEMLSILSIHDYKIQPYSHQENSLVERANKEVLRHLRNFIFNSKVIANWPDFISQVEQIMNSHVSKSTGVAPVDMVFAGQVDLNAGKLFPQTPHPEQVPMSEYMKKLIDQQDQLMKISLKNQHDTDMFHMNKKSIKSITEFPIDSFVTVSYENDEHRPPTKLHNKRRGPFRVISKSTREEGDVYTCKDLVTHKEHDFHVKMLHPFHYDVLRTNVEEVATVEKHYFTVEKVISHKWIDPELALTSKGRNANNLLIEVKWVGYDKPEWNRYNEPSIKKVQEVINYLAQNGLNHLIPIQFRTEQKVKRSQPVQRGRRKRRRTS